MSLILILIIVEFTLILKLKSNNTATQGWFRYKRKFTELRVGLTTVTERK